MEILVYMDDDDKSRWYEITELYNDAISDPSKSIELKNKTAMFWHDTIEKYGVLRNKQLTINQVHGTILSWVGVSELKNK